MSSRRPILFWIASGAAALLIAGCAPNLCQRKAAYFEKCKGGDTTYSEPTCESNLDKCNAAEKARIEAYVMCLEAQKECSFEAQAQCAQQYPGGVNLLCGAGG